MKRVALTTIIGTALCAVAAWGQAPPTALRITAPANNVVVHPGDYLQVTVAPAPVAGAPSIPQVMLSLEGAGYTDLRKAPFQFGLQIPPDATAGPHALRAIGVAAVSKGIDALSDAITVNVERLDRPVRMLVEPASLTMTIYPGMNVAATQERLRAYYVYADGARAAIAAGPGGRLYFYAPTYSVNVDAFGTITARGAGSAQITVECLGCPGYLPSVPVNVWVVAQPMRVGTTAIQAGAGAGSYNIDVTTNGTSYRVEGESWMHGFTSLSLDHAHWSTSVAVDPNPSSQPRVGTVRFTPATGVAEDVVVYQAGKS